MPHGDREVEPQRGDTKGENNKRSNTNDRSHHGKVARGLHGVDVISSVMEEFLEWRCEDRAA
jgi:hypothetical protein